MSKRLSRKSAADSSEDEDIVVPESSADAKRSAERRKSAKKSKGSKPLRKKAHRVDDSSESSSGGSFSGSSSESSSNSGRSSSGSDDDRRTKSERKKKQQQSAEAAKSSSKRSNKRRSTTGSSRSNVAAKAEESEGGGDEEEEEVYCVCQKPYHHEFMFMCDRCQAWFHPKCVGLTKAQIKANPDGLYYCAQCRAIVRAQQQSTAADSSGRKQGLSTREQLVASFAQLLAAASTSSAESTSSKAGDSETKAQRIAGELEAALFECSGRSTTTSLYVSRARFLLYNLNEAKNATLAKRLLSGVLSAPVAAQTNPRVLSSKNPAVLLPAVAAAASVAPPQQPRISAPRKV